MAYDGLWTGATDWGSAEVTAALDSFDKVLAYTNSDAASLSWQDAAQLVVNGDAAFNVMGDWAEGYFRELGKDPMTDYGWAPVPGTGGVFQFLSDSFTLAVGAPHPEGAEAWLKIAGSKAGQEAFNPVKGSICARTDCDPALFGEYLQSAMDDWASDIVSGSLDPWCGCQRLLEVRDRYGSGSVLGLHGCGNLPDCTGRLLVPALVLASKQLSFSQGLAAGPRLPNVA